MTADSEVYRLACTVQLTDEQFDQLVSSVVERLSRTQTPWMTAKEAAGYRRISLDRLHRLAAAGEIPCERDSENGKLFFTSPDLDQWRRSG